MTNKQKSAYSDALIHKQKCSQFSHGDSTRSSQSITQRCQLTSSTIQRIITSKESKCQHKDSELPVKDDDGGGEDDDEREHNLWAPLSLFSHCWSELEACERWRSSSFEASGGGGGLARPCRASSDEALTAIGNERVLKVGRKRLHGAFPNEGKNLLLRLFLGAILVSCCLLMVKNWMDSTFLWVFLCGSKSD